MARGEKNNQRRTECFFFFFHHALQEKSGDVEKTVEIQSHE